ncbi:MAG TPA: hypothetical protein RMF84_18425 [Polyangiaceae bacterium LLY-WYZ-14_1]|nr:hypothetical protein [Polyangiaceae bacterium LLY-WYZ-14_1]
MSGRPAWVNALAFGLVVGLILGIGAALAQLGPDEASIGAVLASAVLGAVVVGALAAGLAILVKRLERRPDTRPMAAIDREALVVRAEIPVGTSEDAIRRAFLETGANHVERLPSGAFEEPSKAPG